MAQLNFSLQDGKYVAEATANADYNLHIERENNGSITVLHSTVNDGEKVPVAHWDYTPLSPSLDEDFDGIVYPKYLKIVSGTPVTSGTITEVS